jgi:hypothetical protein
VWTTVHLVGVFIVGLRMTFIILVFFYFLANGNHNGPMKNHHVARNLVRANPPLVSLTILFAQTRAPMRASVRDSHVVVVARSRPPARARVF